LFTAYLQLYFKTASYRTLVFFLALGILTVLEMRNQRRYEYRCEWMSDNTKDPKWHIFQGKRTKLTFVAVAFLGANSVLFFS